MIFRNNVNIIIVVYNGMQWLKRCLNSCNNFNTIIVDNKSSDNSVRFIQNNYPSITILSQNENLGFGAANNIGISYALKNNADYIFLLNQDAYLEEGTIEKLIEVHKNNINYGILSPIHLNGDGKKLDLNFSNYLQKNKKLLYDSLKHNFTNKVYEVPFVNAAGWLLPKNTLKNIGGFDPIFYHYGEDDNYCQRVLFHGYKIGVVIDSYILHDREFRRRKEEISNKDKLLLKERYLKYKLANINCDIDKNLIKERRKLKIQIIKFILRLRFRSAYYFFKELNLLNKIVPAVRKSRSITKKIGRHYLNIAQ